MVQQIYQGMTELNELQTAHTHQENSEVRGVDKKSCHLADLSQFEGAHTNSSAERGTLQHQ